MKNKTIYLAQHGIASNKADDPARPLSDAGIEQTTLIAKQLKTIEIDIKQIFHSGKLRAQQTADIFATILQIPAVSTLDYLSANDDINILINNLHTDQALYVGHLPYLEKFVSSLLCNDASQQLLKFQNSGVVCLEYDINHYSIKWYITPDTV